MNMMIEIMSNRYVGRIDKLLKEEGKCIEHINGAINDGSSFT